MKTDIHPDYELVTVHCSCGNEFETRSTATELRVELCSECHPFYTGKQKLVDTGGRIDRFERRYGRRKKSGGAPADDAGAVEGPPAGAAAADVELGDTPAETPADEPVAAADEAATEETTESSDS